MNRRFTALADLARLFLFHNRVEILLRVDEDFLAPFLVLEAHLVISAAARRTAGMNAALRFVIGQIVGRHHVGVVNAAGNNRLVGIALEEVDYDFMADSRNVDHAPLLAGPRSGNADPTGAVAIVLAFPVPMKLHLHATVLVGENLFTGWAHHDRRL